MDEPHFNPPLPPVLLCQRVSLVRRAVSGAYVPQLTHLHTHSTYIHVYAHVSLSLFSFVCVRVVVPEAQVRFLHKRFLALDQGVDGYIGSEDLVAEERFTRFNPWFLAFAEVSVVFIFVCQSY